MLVTVIVPAFNEEFYIGDTLDQLNASVYHSFGDEAGVEIIVVDNASADGTAEIARAHGARVVFEPNQNIARARNSGASIASSPWLVFIDADTRVPLEFFDRVYETIQIESCLGGAVDTILVPDRRWVRNYVSLWRYLARITNMAQGAAQFCRKDAFETVGGYDETLFMGEDVDFYWRLKRYAKRSGATTELISDIKVRPSARRFNHWSAWTILVRTNPIVIAIFRRRKSVWGGWYDKPTR